MTWPRRRNSLSVAGVVLGGARQPGGAVAVLGPARGEFTLKQRRADAASPDSEDANCPSQKFVRLDSIAFFREIMGPLGGPLASRALWFAHRAADHAAAE